MTTLTPSRPVEPLLSRVEVADVLGVSLGTVKTLLRQKRLYPVRVMGRVMIEPAELRRYLDAQRDDAR